MTAHLPLLTESRLRADRRCQREEKLRYQDGLVTGRSIALEFGTLGHGALELWWRFNLEAVEHWLAEQKSADPYDVAKLWALMRGYDAMYADDKERFEVIGVEVEFRAPLINPESGAPSKTWQLAGKMDVLVRERATGDVFLIEHKTSSEDITPGASYWVRLRMDGQISMYFTGAASQGHEVRACIYDVIGKPQQRPSAIPLLDDDGVKIVLDAAGARVRTKDGKKWRQTGDNELGYVLQTRPETPEEYGERIFAAIAEEPTAYFARSMVVRLEADMREWQLDTWLQAGQMRDRKRLGVAVKNPEACIRYGSPCGFLPLCTGEANADSYQRVEWKHPELTPPQDAATSKEETENGNATSSTEKAA